MAKSLREPLSLEQDQLIRVIFEPFDASGEWPFWQYADLTLDSRYDLDAADVLASLLAAGQSAPRSQAYGLTWRSDSHMQPQPDTAIALTVAGLRHLAQAEPLLGAFLTTVQYLVEEQRKIVPSPTKVVEATVTSEAIAERLLTASIDGVSGPPVEAMMRKLRQLFKHEPYMYSIVHMPDPAKEEWTVRIPAVLRAYRGIATIDDYLGLLIELTVPAVPPSPPPSTGPLEIPSAVGYLDAVWQNRTGWRLFVNLDPTSIARLTQPCSSEEDFNSMMSALSDVLAQVVVPGKTSPPKRGAALEPVRDYLAASLDGDAADRVGAAMQTLIQLRRIRVAKEHSDARHKAIPAFQQVGLPFPPPSWDYAWTHIAVLAKGALDNIREEIHAGLPENGSPMS
jgi:hypothetical protein